MSDRPRFEPLPCTNPPTALDSGWLPLVQCRAPWSRSVFPAATQNIIDHPEWNSTLILRSELISTDVFTSSSIPISPDIPVIQGKCPTRSIKRRLVPRRPGRDEGMMQICTFYTSCASSSGDDEGVQGEGDTLILTPLLPAATVEGNVEMPYYHPRVRGLAFRYISTPADAILRIEILPLSSPTTSLPDQNTDRILRTSTSLLSALHRYAPAYTKRVVHDVLVERERYQDLYAVLRERHKQWVGMWDDIQRGKLPGKDKEEQLEPRIRVDSNLNGKSKGKGKPGHGGMDGRKDVFEVYILPLLPLLHSSFYPILAHQFDFRHRT